MDTATILLVVLLFETDTNSNNNVFDRNREYDTKQVTKQTAAALPPIWTPILVQQAKWPGHKNTGVARGSPNCETFVHKISQPD